MRTTDRTIYPSLAARRPVRSPFLRSTAPAWRRAMALMSRREPPLVKIHKAIYPLGASWAMDGLREASPLLAQ